MGFSRRRLSHVSFLHGLQSGLFHLCGDDPQWEAIVQDVIVALFPFGKEVDETPAPGDISTIIHLTTGGLQAALVHILFATLMASTVIGIPYAKQHLKLSKVVLTRIDCVLPPIGWPTKLT